MSRMQIEIQVPFDWCQGCHHLEIERTTWLAEGKPYWKEHACKYASVCKECERQRELYEGVADK